MPFLQDFFFILIINNQNRNANSKMISNLTNIKVSTN